MTPFEYLLSLISVLVGLAVADLATSLHRLLRARRRVRWDWLPLGAALLAVLAVLEFWWVFFEQQELELGSLARIAGFLPVAGQLVLLFLMNAAALPDEVPAEGLDLKLFYEEQRSYFWSLYAVYIGSVIALRIATLVGAGWDAGDWILSVVPNVLVMVSFVALALSGRRWLHAAVILLWLVVFNVSWWRLTLG